MELDEQDDVRRFLRIRDGNTGWTSTGVGLERMSDCHRGVSYVYTENVGGQQCPVMIMRARVGTVVFGVSISKCFKL